MMKRALLGLAFLLTPVLALAQDARLTYDVATVKLNPCGGPKSNRASSDQILITDQTLKQLVVLAYSVQPPRSSPSRSHRSRQARATGRRPPAPS